MASPNRLLRRSTYYLIALLTINGFFYLFLRKYYADWASHIIGFTLFVSSLLFISYTAKWFDNIWPRNAAGDGGTIEPLKSIGHLVFKWTGIITCAILLLLTCAVVFFIDPSNVKIPLQPFITFFLSGLWFMYVLYALSSLVSIEGNKPQALASFGKNSIIGAIVLSIYFLVPFDWAASAIYQSYEYLVQGKVSDVSFPYASNPGSTLSWLQSTAIPSLVSIGFGFITAYVTSLVWYEYYEKLTKVGLQDAEANRQGRNPNRDKLWFGRLSDCNSTVSLSGATLGGWFKNWPKFRSSLEILAARGSVSSVNIILPDPGSPFFWLRRRDELNEQAVPGDDVILRLSNTLLTIYYCLHGQTDQNNVGYIHRFLRDNFKTEVAERDLQIFRDFFTRETAGRLAIFLQDKENDKFITSCGRGESKIQFKISQGIMLGASILDDDIFFVPYLPLIDDKDCPEFILKRNSELGIAIERSIDLSAEKAVRLTCRDDVIAIIYRMWISCNDHRDDLTSFSEIPWWLRATKLEVQQSIRPVRSVADGMSQSSHR